ncbi:hypothetical protein STEG23_013943, partial [Scotinomys teguina]
RLSVHYPEYMFGPQSSSLLRETRRSVWKYILLRVTMRKALTQFGKMRQITKDDTTSHKKNWASVTGKSLHAVTTQNKSAGICKSLGIYELDPCDLEIHKPEKKASFILTNFVKDTIRYYHFNL